MTYEEEDERNLYRQDYIKTHHLTGRCCQVGNTSASYSEGKSNLGPETGYPY
jgi:hypothetical protein